jgi:hypothetical protein
VSMPRVRSPAREYCATGLFTRPFTTSSPNRYRAFAHAQEDGRKACSETK